MKLSNLSVIFVIVIIPIILVVSYYISLQIDTTNMQTSYNSKLLDATKEAIEAFEINTVEWNEAYSETADSKRRDVMASINTFTTSFANSLGIGGTSKENILTYIPAIACTLYDGYYIYSPADVKSIVKDENGVAVFMTEDLAKGRKSEKVSDYTYNDDDEEKLLYEANQNGQGKYINNGITQEFTLNPNDAKSTYSHILKPFTAYSARYANGNTDITVNYTLDNYITVYGKVNGEYQMKSGYYTNNINIPNPEKLTERIAYTYNKRVYGGVYNYVYAEDNTKVYFDVDTPFQVSSTGERTDLENMKSQKYKKVLIDNKTYYQALINYDINKDGEIKNGEDIIAGKLYEKRGDVNTEKEDIQIDKKLDYSAINYYYESKAFSDWIYSNLSSNLSSIKIKDIQSNEIEYENQDELLFNESENPEDEDSIFSKHRKEIIKQSLISNLNQAITSYSRRNSEGNYQLPVLSETDWNQILRNVSMVTFVQNMPIGMKYYNNYAVATSTANKEYVNPDEIYLNGSDGYYHMPYCEKLKGTNLIGYRNTDYVMQSYIDNNKENKNYYRHQDIANQSCYYCLVQRDLFSSDGLNKDEKALHEKAYQTALARERYVSHEFR